MNIPDKVQVWRFAGKPGNLKTQNAYETNSGYNLFCRSNEKYLTWEKQTLGVNLGYEGTGKERKIHLRTPDGKERQVMSGEQIAFGIGGDPAFLMYAERTVGINLEWSEKPLFEWRIYAHGGPLGVAIPTGSFVSIVNEKVKPNPDFLIYMDRPGADVGWTTSPSFWDSLTAAAEKAAIQAAKTYIKSQVPVAPI